MCDFTLPIVLFILSLIFFGVYRFIKQETCRHENRTRVDNGPWGDSLGTFSSVKIVEKPSTRLWSEII